MPPFPEVWRIFAEFGYFLKWVWRQFFISIRQPWLKAFFRNCWVSIGVRFGQTPMMVNLYFSLFFLHVFCIATVWVAFHIFFFSVYSCLLQSVMLEMPSFLSHYWIPVLWWVNDATVGALSKCFTHISVGRDTYSVNHLFCTALWLTIFCALCCLIVHVIWTTSL